METLHLYGLYMIQNLQVTFKNYSELMMFLSHVGDPKNVFIIYFPITYFSNVSCGLKMLWLTAVTEWLNSVFKWVLHGERPYWWVHEAYELSKYTSGTVIQQVKMTCETGPGSPSGHSMVTAAALFVMAYESVKNCRLMIKVAVWSSYAFIIIGVCLSRCFIAAHFPHQVFVGSLAGALIAWFICKQFSDKEMTANDFLVTTLILFILAALINGTLMFMGFDLLWSVAKARRWCKYRDWVHIHTSLYYAFVRDFGSLSGVALGLLCSSKTSSSTSRFHVKLFQMVVSVVLAVLIMDYIPLPKYNNQIFYLLGFMKHLVLFFSYTVIVPLFQNLFN